jgi:hypothetical protein
MHHRAASCAAVVCSTAVTFTFTFAIGPALALRMQIPAAYAGVASSVLFSLPLLCNIPALLYTTAVAQKVGVTCTVRASHAWLTVFTLASAFAARYEVFLLLRCLAALGGGPLGLCRHLSPSVASTVLALLAGMLIGPMLGTALYDDSDRLPQRASVLAVSILNAAAAATVPRYDQATTVANMHRSGADAVWSALGAPPLLAVFAFRIILYSSDQVLVLGAHAYGVPVHALTHVLTKSNGVALVVAVCIFLWPRAVNVSSRGALLALSIVCLAFNVAIGPALRASRDGPLGPIVAGMLVLRGVTYGASVMAASAYFSRYSRGPDDQMAFQVNANLAVTDATPTLCVSWWCPIHVAMDACGVVLLACLHALSGAVEGTAVRGSLM